MITRAAAGRHMARPGVALCANDDAGCPGVRLACMWYAWQLTSPLCPQFRPDRSGPGRTRSGHFAASDQEFASRHGEECQRHLEELPLLGWARRFRSVTLTQPPNVEGGTSKRRGGCYLEGEGRSANNGGPLAPPHTCCVTPHCDNFFHNRQNQNQKKKRR